jgi:WD repeat-containing protein 22
MSGTTIFIAHSSNSCMLSHEHIGGDDRRVLMWNVQKSLMTRDEPKMMVKQHLSNIFCLGFDSTNSRIFSGGNDDCTIVHDVQT